MIRRVALPLVIALVIPTPKAAAQAGFERAIEEFDFAVNVAFAPDGTMFVADKDVGQIRVVRDGRLLREPFATVAAFSPVNEMGLLGVAVHPEFPAAPWVYAYYSDANDAQNHLIRFRAEGDVAVERQDLLTLLPTTAGWHNGGDLAFGPDGKLYVTVGEGHDAERAQDTNDLGGKILRLEPDGSVPPDNPLGPSNPAYAMGIRNSFGICFDPETGELWSTENGPSGDDELNLIEAGENYGWPIVQGAGGDPRFVDPVVNFPEAIVPTGCAGSVANGGLYFGGGYNGNLYRMQIPGLGADDRSPVVEVVAQFEGGVTDVARGPGGALWVVTPNALYRRAPAARPNETTTATATPEPEPTSPAPTNSPAPSGGSGLATGMGLVVAAILLAGLLLMRSRLLRR